MKPFNSCTGLRRFGPVVAATLALIAAPMLASAQDDEADDQVQRVYIDYVKPGSRVEFEALTKEWNGCLEESDARTGWNVYMAQTGKQLRYAFVVPHQAWADFDREDEGGMNCFLQFEDRYSATIHGTRASFDVYIPEASNPVDMESKVAMVTDFRVKNYRQFRQNIEAIAGAARDAEWEYPHYFYSSISGEGGADFFVVVPARNYAGFDGDTGFWAMVREQLGEAEFERILSENRENIQESSTEIWEHRADLSFVPGGDE